MDKKNKLEHPCFPQPLDIESKVWRYMDLSKLLYLISRQNLFLSRLDLFNDAHEGSIPKINSIERLKFEQEHYGRNSIESFWSPVTKQARKSTYVNCWRLDDIESEAMWKLYCPDNKGIAIQTTYKKLVKSINYDDSLYIGQVNYIDFEKEWFPDNNAMYPVMHKRKAFEHEKEVRLVKSDPAYWAVNSPESPIGINCKWDTNTIENIFVNPYSEAWYFETVSEVLNKYGTNINLIWSSLKGLPYY